MSLPRTIRFLPYAAMLFGVACVVPVSASQIDVLLSVDNRAGGNEGAVNTGYQYFGGITRWTNPSGGYKSRSPVNSAQVSPLMLIAADVTAKIDGKWGAGRPTCYSRLPGPQKQRRPAHRRQSGLRGRLGELEEVRADDFHPQLEPRRLPPVLRLPRGLGRVREERPDRQAALLMAPPIPGPLGC